MDGLGGIDWRRMPGSELNPKDVDAMNARISDPMPAALRGARALQAAHYVGEDMHELDRRAVFGHSWQLIAHHGQLAEPGDHVVDTVAGTPVILLRGRDGVLRAFPNVCRHRAGPLANCSGKGMHNLRCKYHGWLYDQEGRLIGAPEMQDATDFDAGEVHLPRLRTSEWQGLVFVALDPAVPDFGPVDDALHAPGRVRRGLQLEGVRGQLPRGLPPAAGAPGPFATARLPRL